MELTKPQIKRIDTFLENLGCEYIDIRFEMVDHIATDIEQNITNHDEFFKKDKLRGKFFLYMMSKREEFEDSYHKQSKKQFWTNFGFTLKEIGRELLNVKILLFIFMVVFIFNKATSINIFYPSLIILIVTVLNFGYTYYLLNKEVKEMGKLRIVHTFISLSMFAFLLINQFYNYIKLLLKHDNEVVYFAYAYLFFMIYNTLLTIVFIKNKNKFKNKYKYLLN